MLPYLRLIKGLKRRPTSARKYSTTAQADELPGIVGQRVFVGPNAVSSMKAASKYSHPLLVSDNGIVSLGIFGEFRTAYFNNSHFFTQVQPNPSVANVLSIHEAYLLSGADGIVGLGGGGPMDASRAAAFVIAAGRINADWAVRTTEDVEKLLGNCRSVMATISKDEKLQRNYNEALPALSLVPTTAGTGSDGGKSAVISMTNGRKLVFGHPSLMAPTVALNPAYTISMPARMTAATGVDALLHSLEAYFVTYAAAVNDGLNDEEIGITDGYALKGVKLILDNLPKVMANPKDLAARQQMQIAALYGAKAFRKGDLGAVHATAHTIGALHHLHHGEAIARMTVPVFRYNETRASDETSKKFDNIREIFNKHGYKGATLSESVSSFLKTLNLPYGLEGIEHRNDWDNMADMASKDGCGTNPIKLSVADYKKIFIDAAKL